MLPRQSQRNRKPTVAWEAKEAPSAALGPKLTSKTARNKPETALKPVAVEPLPESTKLDSNQLPELPVYTPPLELHYKPSESIATGLSELDTFQKLLTPAVVDLMVNATNSYTENARKITDEYSARPWSPVNSTEIWRYIGCLLYMGEHIERERSQYWSNTHHLGESLSKIRFEQIHRYFTLRDGSVHPMQEGESFVWRVEPIATIVRQNCSANWIPSSHLAIDEAMVPYTGRLLHKVKLKNKPINEGYKIWVLGDSGYAYDWLWHSHQDGPEGIPKRGIEVDQLVPKGPRIVRLAPTYALIIRLATRLRRIYPERVFCLFLDNLFLNLNVSHALLALNICCTGTTRKNASGIPLWLIELKENNRSLVWDSTLAETVGYTLCFLWQDNNAVLGITTAYSLKETIERLRKRPSLTSINARTVRPVFGEEHSKLLSIPLAIDGYNHYMNGVDTHNHLRKNLTVHRPYETRNWRPLWYYILDTCSVNSYLIWKGNSSDVSKRAHRRFRQSLSKELRNTPYPDVEIATKKRRYSKIMPIPNREALAHNWVPLEKREYCVWCQKHAEKSAPKRSRPALAQLVNGEQINSRIRPSRSQFGCHICNVCLCRKGSCWQQFHSQTNTI
jgi:Transposase IS4